jgi:putative tryptophan/tyrosine transport system substrate-binding protein
MKPRRLLLLALVARLSGHAALLRAQTSLGSMRRVGVLTPSTQAKDEINLKPFFSQMRELGWIEGQNILYDWACADDQQERLPRLAAELVTRKPELIFAPPTPAAVAAKQATQTIPIVFGSVADPVGVGLVSSLARPGGNVTGLTGSVAEPLTSKRIQLLMEILPGVKRIGLLVDPDSPGLKQAQQSLAPLAASLGLTFILADAANPAEFDAAVGRLLAQRVEAIVIGGSVLAFNMRGRLVELANQKRIPVVATNTAFAEAGALLTYGASLGDLHRRSALVVDKILKGAKPADIPVEQPTLFELIVNLKSAKALGIKIPQSILLRADRVIE